MARHLETTAGVALIVTDLRAIRSKLSEFPVPYTLLVDATGEVVNRWPGVLTGTWAQEVIESVACLK